MPSPSRTSLTRRAITPSTTISRMPGPRSSGGITVAHGTRPTVGLIDAIPQQCAGLRSEPPTSLPSPSGDMPDASADPSPPLEPPAVTFGSHGLRVSPRSDESVWIRSPRSGRFVRAIGIAPAARRRSTWGASTGETASASAGTPDVVGVPARSMFSLTVTGTPWSAPSGADRSAASAAARASSASTSVIALRWPLTASIRSRCASTTSRDDTARVAINSASSPAPRRHRSSDTLLLRLGSS